jgi:uncharacterized membrane protein YoaK (UPF0700 family)
MRNFGLSRPEGQLESCTLQAHSEYAEPISPSTGNSAAFAGLPLVLSVAAGSVDVIGFLALNGLFTAHITGNIVILAARFVAGEQALLSHLLAVPAFMLVLGLTRLAAAWLERVGIPALLPLLLLELILLLGFLIIGVSVDPHLDPNSAGVVVAGMMGIAAMAVQNALVRLSLAGVPSTSVMTTNVTAFTMDIGDILLAQNASRAARARERALRTGIVIVGFVIGCAFGAACEHSFGLRSLAVPIGLLLTAVALGLRALPQPGS